MSNSKNIALKVDNIWYECGMTRFSDGNWCIETINKSGTEEDILNTVSREIYDELYRRAISSIQKHDELYNLQY